MAPGSKRPAPLRASFWKSLRTFLHKIKARSVIMLCGDLNAHLGSQAQPPWLEARGFEESGDDDNGEELRALCLEFDLVILNRQGPPHIRTRNSSTWHGGQDYRGHMLDFVLVSRRSLFAQRGACRTEWSLPLRQADTKDDHRPLLWRYRRTELWAKGAFREAAERGTLRHLSWDRCMLVRLIREVRQSEYQDRSGADRPFPEKAATFRQDVIRHLKAIGPLPKATAQATRGDSGAGGEMACSRGAPLKGL